MRRCLSVRSSSPTRRIASWCWSNWPRSGWRPMSCWSRCGGIPVRRLRPARYSPQMRDNDGDRSGARRRSRRSRYRCFCRRLPAGAGRGRCGTHRHLRRPARARRHRIRLYQPRRRHFRRGSRGCEVRREAGSGNGRRIYQGRISLEQRQFHVSRLCSARRISQRRCDKRAGRHRCRDQGRARSRICHARCGRIRSRRKPSRSITR